MATAATLGAAVYTSDFDDLDRFTRDAVPFAINASTSTFATMAANDRPEVDFGRAANDYAKHRPGFPPVFFDHVKALGIGAAGQRILDLGTGTGTLACGPVVVPRDSPRVRPSAPRSGQDNGHA